jgi:hypothetical protein
MILISTCRYPAEPSDSRLQTTCMYLPLPGAAAALRARALDAPRPSPAASTLFEDSSALADGAAAALPAEAVDTALAALGALVATPGRPLHAARAAAVLLRGTVAANELQHHGAEALGDEEEALAKHAVRVQRGVLCQPVVSLVMS